MNRFLPYILWSSTALGLLSLALIVGYAARNSSGHTGWEPFTSLLLFVPLALGGGLGFALRHRYPGLARASLGALTVGLAGLVLIITLDHTNRLVQYGRWIQRGQP